MESIVFCYRGSIVLSVPIHSHFSQEKHQGNPNGGLANGGLAQKAPVGPKRALSGQFLLSLRLWGVEELVPIGPEQAPTGPVKAPISPEKARFSRTDFPPIFSENLGLK